MAQSAEYLNPVLTRRRRVKRPVFQPRRRARVTLEKVRKKFAPQRAQILIMPQHYLATTVRRRRDSHTLLFPEFLSAFSQRLAGANLDTAVHRMFLARGITRPEEFRRARARAADGVRLIELVVRDFPASGGKRGGSDDVLFDTSRRRVVWNEEKSGGR